MRITGNEPANPFFTWNEAGNGDSITIYDSNGGKQHFAYQQGLTIRQHFAVMAMQGILNTYPNQELKYSLESIVVVLAVKYADMLIEELNKTEK